MGDSNSIFFNVMCIGCVLNIMLLPLTEGPSHLRLAVAGLLDNPVHARAFLIELWLSGANFFLYQLAQIKLMSKMSAINFSVITPMSKAFVIVSCALYFGEHMSA